MNFDAYQLAAADTALYPADHEIVYPALGLASEAGEVIGKLKKGLRGDGLLDVDGIGYELGDVLWYVAMLATDLGLSLQDIARDNLEKLRIRQANNTLQGNGDNR